jgi:hypothetical protein
MPTGGGVSYSFIVPFLPGIGKKQNERKTGRFLCFSREKCAKNAGKIRRFDDKSRTFTRIKRISL